jgi:hypothetical protein
VSEMVEWLRATIEGDKAAAEEAAKVYPPPWTLREKDPGGDERDWDIHEAEYAFIKACSTCEHSGIHEAPGRHIAIHDPRDTIARCDAELAILDLYAEADYKRDHPGPADPTHLTTAFLAIGEAVGLIGDGYRHRDGWKDEWRD